MAEEPASSAGPEEAPAADEAPPQVAGESSNEEADSSGTSDESGVVENAKKTDGDGDGEQAAGVVETSLAAEPFWEDGRYVFVDPATKQKQFWDEGSSQWLSAPPPTSSSSSSVKDKEENEDEDAPGSAAPATGSASSYRLQDGTYRYRDEASGKEFVWDAAAAEWRVNEFEYFADEKTGRQCYRDPADGMVHEWDAERRAWFPKIDDDFLAVYQMNYGVTATETEEEEEEGKEKEKGEKDDEDGGRSDDVVAGKEEDGNGAPESLPSGGGEGVQDDKPKKRKADPPSWFQMDEERNTNVYVQGLPLDITEEEFVATMSKCGLLAKDADTGKMKVKLYRNADGRLKGDGRCCYIRRESVELALQILDGYNLRGFNLKVEQAQFTLKGAYDPTKKPRKKKKQEKEKLKKMQEKLLAWKPDELRGQRPRSDKVVVLKNLFDPEAFKRDPKLILDLKNELVVECQKFGGAKKVMVHDRHPDGVAEIVFKEFEHSDLCVQIMNRRLFGDRRLVAELWDGKTKYRIEETEEEKKERLSQWEKFLETDA